MRADTGGEGAHPGGDGVIREYLFHDHATVTLVTERRRFAPWGLAGGGDAATGRNTLERAGGAIEELAARVQVDVGPGDRLRVETPGGGGWGTVER